MEGGALKSCGAGRCDRRGAQGQQAPSTTDEDDEEDHRALVDVAWSHEGSPGGEEMAAVGDAQTQPRTQLHHHEGEGTLTNDLCRLVTRATVYGTANIKRRQLVVLCVQNP
jgi:hypothetical protein